LVLLVKKTTLYAERNEEKRQQFLLEIEQIDPGNLVWLDESGIDECLQRNYARAPRGKQVISEIYGKKYGRISVIAAWLSEAKKIIAPYVFHGYTDTKMFNGWLKKCLLPELKKGQVVIMDNAAFHKSKLTQDLIESVGCKILYQPPYSPDLNPIEKQWAILKQKFRKHKHKFDNFNDAVDYAFVA
jgi:isfu1 transposase